MLILLSPAKTLDMESPSRVSNPTEPAFLDASQKLVSGLKRMSRKKLGELMSISDALADVNSQRFKQWSLPFDANNARPAIEAFRGDVYTGFDVDTANPATLDKAQQQVRILSGLYGVLRPHDLMQAYRLEMGTRLKTRQGASLYEFWGDRLTDHLNAELATLDDPLVVNLASNEYFKSVNAKRLVAPLYSPVFHDQKNDEYKMISFFAKKARGAMARQLLENDARTARDLQGFNALGYRYVAKESTEFSPLFRRTEKAARQAAEQAQAVA